MFQKHTFSVGDIHLGLPLSWLSSVSGHPSQGHPSRGHPSRGHPSRGHPSRGHPSLRHPSGSSVSGSSVSGASVSGASVSGTSVFETGKTKTNAQTDVPSRRHLSLGHPSRLSSVSGPSVSAPSVSETSVLGASVSGASVLGPSVSAFLRLWAIRLGLPASLGHPSRRSCVSGPSVSVASVSGTSFKSSQPNIRDYFFPEQFSGPTIQQSKVYPTRRHFLFATAPPHAPIHTQPHTHTHHCCHHQTHHSTVIRQ